MGDVELGVELVSPSGEVYSETVFVPVDEFRSRRKGTYDCVIDYREGLVPVEWGVWRMSLAVREIGGLRGIGVINRKINGKG